MNRCPCPVRAAGEAAFTLVDLLMALCIVGACMGAVYGVFRTGFMAWERGTNDSELGSSGMYIIDALCRDLRAGFPPTPEARSGDRSEPLPAFEGKTDSVAFYSSSGKPGSVQWPAHRLRYYLDKSQYSEWGVLRVEDMPTAGSAEMVEEPSDEMLASRVFVFQLRYLSENGWVDEWKGTEESLPSAVEINLDMASDDGKVRRMFRTVVDIPANRAGSKQ